jgi:hypothetical protein
VQLLIDMRPPTRYPCTISSSSGPSRQPPRGPQICPLPAAHRVRLPSRPSRTSIERRCRQRPPRTLPPGIPSPIL